VTARNPDPAAPPTGGAVGDPQPDPENPRFCAVCDRRFDDETDSDRCPVHR